MIYLDNLERTLKLASDYVDDGLHFLTEPVSYGVLELLVERLISAEKDAARYRWLRDEARHHMGGAPLAFMTNYDGEPIAYPECGMVLHESYLDEAIDEAMQCNK